MSDTKQANFRVDYIDPAYPATIGSTTHETEEEARQQADDYVRGGSPDTRRTAYVSRPVAVYYMRHAVSSVSYEPISALTPPLQHKGGETEAGDKLAEFMKREGAVKWEGGEACPMAFGAEADVLWDSGRSDRIIVDSYWLDGVMWQHHGEGDDILAYRIVETTADQVRTTDSDASSGDERIEPPISTLQASSGEGETTLGALNGGKAFSVYVESAATGEGASMHFDTEELAAGYAKGMIGVEGVTRVHYVKNPDQTLLLWEPGPFDQLSPTEPAAYSPVNNADEPVTKPEADFFAQALIPVQPGIEFSVDGGPKQATGAAKLFGGIFAKRVDA